MPDPADNNDKTPDPKPKKQKGFLARVWNGIFRRSGDDYEKRLQYLSKEEAAVHARMKRRAQGWRITARNVVLVSVVAEVVAVIYAIITTKSLYLSWQMRAMRVSPMFLLPGLSFVIYSALASFIRMRDQKDQKTLEKLRSERKAKIDELKERTNYYTTQQLIQRYDLDPAAKAAAATVLASKLGADSGLNMYLGDESKSDATTGKSNDVKLVQSDGLRNRKQPASTGQNPAAGVSNQFVSDEMSQKIGPVGQQSSLPGHRVEHYRSSGPNEGGWIARIAAMLVGEDPTQSYALICGNCHMHNGLARKEDFPYVTYYCPHCQALNGPSQQEELQHGSGTASGSASPPTNGDAAVTRTPSSTSSMLSETDGAGTTAPVQEHPVKQSNAEGSIGPT